MSSIAASSLSILLFDFLDHFSALDGSIAFDKHHSQIHPSVGNQRKWVSSESAEEDFHHPCVGDQRKIWVSSESAGEDFHHPCVANQREWFLGSLLVGKISTTHFA
jgi:hypothetical protein